jgi:hypothetical protein
MSSSSEQELVSFQDLSEIHIARIYLELQVTQTERDQLPQLTEFSALFPKATTLTNTEFGALAALTCSVDSFLIAIERSTTDESCTRILPSSLQMIFHRPTHKTLDIVYLYCSLMLQFGGLRHCPAASPSLLEPLYLAWAPHSACVQ